MLLRFPVAACYIRIVILRTRSSHLVFLCFEIVSWYVAAVRQEISDETDRETGRSSKVISTVPIHLSIFSPNGKRRHCTSEIFIKKKLDMLKKFQFLYTGCEIFYHLCHLYSISIL